MQPSGMAAQADRSRSPRLCRFPYSWSPCARSESPGPSPVPAARRADGSFPSRLPCPWSWASPQLASTGAGLSARPAGPASASYASARQISRRPARRACCLVSSHQPLYLRGREPARSDRPVRCSQAHRSAGPANCPHRTARASGNSTARPGVRAAATTSAANPRLLI